MISGQCFHNNDLISKSLRGHWFWPNQWANRGQNKSHPIEQRWLKFPIKGLTEARIKEEVVRNNAIRYL